MIELFVVTDVCENPNILSSIYIISRIVTMLYYLVPILLVIMLIIDLGKNIVVNGNEIGKNTSMIVKRVISAMIFFMVPTIINTTLDFVVLDNEDLSQKWESCLENSQNITYYKRKYQLLKEKDDAEFKEKRKKYYMKISQKHSTATITKRPEPVITTDGGDGEISTGNFNGQTYNLDDETIRKLVSKAITEQGNDVTGVGFELSLMANLYELQGRKYGSILNYVMNSGWFGNAAAYMNGNPGPELMAVGRDVLVNGNRTLPLYVNEHDCWFCHNYADRYQYCSNGNLGDICWIQNDGKQMSDRGSITNRSNYIRDKTIIKSVYYTVPNSYYIFYVFAPNGGDPFGYTPEAKRAVTGGG